MTREQQETPSPSPVERLTQHLITRPYDLIDARALMMRFQVTVKDFQQALARLEQHVQPQQ